MSMKKSRVAVCLLCLMTLTTVLCGCGQIEDKNGTDDHSLCTVTEEELVSNFTKFKSVGSVQSHIGDKFTLSVKKLSGVSSYYDFSVKESESKTLEFETVLNSGNIRIYIFGDGEIVADIPIGEKYTYVCNKVGNYEVRVAGESANFSMTINK